MVKFSHAFVKKLQEQYLRRTPTYARVLSILSKVGVQVKNDHMALRSFSLPKLGISFAENRLLRAGYEKRDAYQFPEKHLSANWYAPPSADLPRVFVSQLHVVELSKHAQDIISAHMEPAMSAVADSSAVTPFRSETEAVEAAEELDSFVEKVAPLSLEEYKLLGNESQYAAWTLLHGYRVNHCTLSLDQLEEPLNHMVEFVRHARDHWRMKMRVNTEGGMVELSEDGKLLQSSTMADAVKYNFTDAPSVDVPGAFVEFIERHREGFDAGNATKIFESTASPQ